VARTQKPSAGPDSPGLRRLAAGIRSFHALGTRLRAGLERAGYGDGYFDAQAKKGTRYRNADTLRKAAAFADPGTGYDPGELDALLDQVRRHHHRFARRGTRFGLTHLVRLLSVPKAGRAGLQKRCLAGGWGTAELEAAIRARFGRPRRRGGRRPHVPNDRAGVLVRVHALCLALERWHAELAGRPRSGRVAGRPAGAGLLAGAGAARAAVEVSLDRAADRGETRRPRR
jgi:hypothetical protein